jgi:serine/threonine-protein kinase
VLSLDGDRKVKPLIAVPGKDAWGPKFSPDGRWIAYVTDESTRPEVYVQPYPLTGAKYLISPDGGDMARWSADGKQLFFLGQNSVTGGTAGLGAHRIMAVDIHTQPSFTASTPVVLPIETFSDSFAVTPDGRFLLPLPRSETTASDKTPLQIQVFLNWFDELKRRTAKN